MSKTERMHAMSTDLKALVIYLKRRAIWLAAAALMGGLIAYLWARWTPATFKAEHTFFINSEASAMPSGFSNILGTVGLDYNEEDRKIEKIQVIANSDRTLRAVLMDSVQLTGKADLIANHLISQYSHNKKGRLYKTFGEGKKIIKQIETDSETKAMNQLMRIIHNEEIKHFGHSFRKNAKSGLMSLYTTTINPDLSYSINKSAYAELSRYYIQQTTAKPTQTVATLEQRRDSLSSSLASAESRLAAYDRRNNALWSPEDTYRRDKLSRQVQFLSLAVAEIEKNLQEALFVLENTTPYFQLIDQPSLPLLADQPVPSIYAGAGGLVGLLIGLALVGLRDIWKHSP